MKDPIQNLTSGVNGPVGEVCLEGTEASCTLTGTVFEFARTFEPDPLNVDTLDFYVPDVGGSTWIAFYAVVQMGKGAQGNTEYPDFRVFQPIYIELK